jgi:hypothetical protein
MVLLDGADAPVVPAFRHRERSNVMLKRLVCAALALSLLGATAASARPWSGSRHYDRGSHYSYSHHGWRGHRDNGAGVALGIGLGLFALAAIASQNDDRYYDYGPPPPPPPAYRGGYYYGY